MPNSYTKRVVRSNWMLCALLPILSCSAQSVARGTSSNASPAPDLLVILGSPPQETAKAVWDSLTMPANVLVNPPSFTGRIIRNALYVRFKRDASLEARASAITRISGEVVGGHLISPRDGFYLIRVPILGAPGDSTSGPLLRARRLLDSDPSVGSTLLATLNSPL